MNDVEYVEGRNNKEPFSKRKHARKVTWLNPPFSKNVTTKVDQKFVKLINKHFPVGSKLRKVFNQNMVKVSYSCMPSMGSILKQHNAHTCICGADEERGSQPRSCNCHKPERSALNRHCLANKIVYKATVGTDITHALKSVKAKNSLIFQPQKGGRGQDKKPTRTKQHTVQNKAKNRKQDTRKNTRHNRTRQDQDIIIGFM